MKEDESPKSLRYQENSMYSLSDALSQTADEIVESPTKKRSPAVESNNHLITYLRVETVYRDTLFISCACSVIGAILVTKGLRDHLLSYTSICLSLVTPVASTIAYHTKIGPQWAMRQIVDGEQVDISYELGFLFVAIMGMALVSTLQEESYHDRINHEEKYVFKSWIENVMGSTLIGIGIGLYKRIANAAKPAAPRYCTVHIFFYSVLALTVTPYLKYPSVANQIRAEHAKDFVDGEIDPSITASYYQNRGPAMIYFLVNGLLLTIVILSMSNALQHPMIKESSLNSTFTFINVVTCFAFDNWVLLRNKEVVYYTKGVNFLIFCLMAGYFLLQYYKQQAVKDRLQQFIFNN